MSEKPKAHVSDAKKAVVKKIVDMIKKYPIVAAVNLEDLPASQLQNMRTQLRDKIELFMTKRRLMKLAIEEVKKDKPGIEKIEEHLLGMPALLVTNENPFSLFKTLKKSKSKAPAKGGQIAPDDIVVPAGPTPFVPGPVIGELGALGIVTKVEEGKITVQEDSVVCKRGEEISAELAAMLTRLNIMPMEVGLNITAVFEKGDIFTSDVLDIDEEQFMIDLNEAARIAFNSSMEIGYITDLNKETMIQKAFREAKAVALETSFLADAVVEELLAKAEMQAGALKSSIPELPEGAAEKEAPKEDAPAEAPKVEEKTEEPKVEEAKPKAEEPAKEEPKEEETSEAPASDSAQEPKVTDKAPEPAPEAPAPEPVKEEPKVEEKPAEEPVKEEPKEEKAPEPAPEAPKKEKAEEPAPKPEVVDTPKDDVVTKDQEMTEKVADMVEKVKQREEGTTPTAESILDEVSKDDEKKEMNKVAELAEKIRKDGGIKDTDLGQEEEKKEEKEKKEDKKEEKDEDEVANLTEELLKKGTLRK